MTPVFSLPAAGVWFVCVDRRPSASPGGCATSRGCHPHHSCHCLVHGVCQQHCHYYHLSACLGRAGKVIPWQEQLSLCPLLALPLGWVGLCWVCAGTGTGEFSCSWASGSSKPLGATTPVAYIMWALKDNNPSDCFVRDVIVYYRVWDGAVHHWLFASFGSSVGSSNPQGPISVPFWFSRPFV